MEVQVDVRICAGENGGLETPLQRCRGVTKFDIQKRGKEVVEVLTRKLARSFLQTDMMQNTEFPVSKEGQVDLEAATVPTQDFCPTLSNDESRRSWCTSDDSETVWLLLPAPGSTRRRN